jgi:hypothetical protein
VLGSLEVCPDRIHGSGSANSRFAVAEQTREQEAQQRKVNTLNCT